MRLSIKSALSSLPLPPTTTWPEGVWDKTVFSHGTMSVLVFTPRGRDYQTSHTQAGAAAFAIVVAFASRYPEASASGLLRRAQRTSALPKAVVESAGRND